MRSLIVLALAITADCTGIRTRPAPSGSQQEQVAANILPTPTPSPSPAPIQEIELRGEAQIRMHKYKDVSRKLKYSIEGEYPYFIGQTAHARSFNRQIRIKIAKQYTYATHPNIRDFREHVRLSPKQNPLETVEFSYEILCGNQNLLSIRFHDMTYSYGAAHPLESYFSINFDVKRGEIVSLARLFRQGSQFMNKITKIAKSKLDEQKVFTFPDAIEAELKRHLEWNITADGFVVNFDRCAVSACADGERSVVILYAELKDILRWRDPRFSHLLDN